MKRTQNEILALYDKYYEMVWRICLVRFGNAHDAYDATQETFVRLMNYNKAFYSKEHEKAWLIRTAVNNLLQGRHEKQPKETGNLPGSGKALGERDDSAGIQRGV